MVRLEGISAFVAIAGLGIALLPTFIASAAVKAGGLRIIELGTDLADRIGEIHPVAGILFCSSNIELIRASRCHGHAALVKPFRAAALVRAVEITQEIARTGRASPSFPLKFHCAVPLWIDPPNTSGSPLVNRTPCRQHAMASRRNRR